MIIIKNGDAFEYEDLRQICYLGLVKAVRTYEDDKHIAFSTYAYVVIKNEINMELRKYKKRVKTISFETPISDENLTLEDMLQSDIDLEEDVINKDNYKVFYNQISNLKGIEKDAILLRLKGKTQYEIAQILGTSQSYASRIIKRAIDKIKSKI